MTNRIVLDVHSFKALAAPTRLEILKLLDKRPHTTSELAEQLQFAVPTIKEHLDSLEGARLVLRTDDGHKWKYYKLTPKGHAVLTPHETNFTILLATTALSALGATYSLYKYFHDGLGSFAQETISATAPKMMAGLNPMAAQAAALSPIPDYNYLIIAIAFTTILVGSLYVGWRMKESP